MSEAKGLGVLIRSAQAGNASARAALMDSFSPCVEQVCRDASIRTAADLSSTDVVQEAWLRIWQKFHQFRGSTDEVHLEATLFNWLRQTARSVIVNLCESRGAQCRNPPTPLIPLQPHPYSSSSVEQHLPTVVARDETPSDIAIAHEEAVRIEAAIESLVDPTDRDIIRSRFFSGVSLMQTAELLQISYDDARQRFNNALARLGIELSQLE